MQAVPEGAGAGGAAVGGSGSPRIPLVFRYSWDPMSTVGPVPRNRSPRTRSQGRGPLVSLALSAFALGRHIRACRAFPSTEQEYLHQKHEE